MNDVSPRAAPPTYTTHQMEGPKGFGSPVRARQREAKNDQQGCAGGRSILQLLLQEKDGRQSFVKQ